MVDNSPDILEANMSRLTDEGYSVTTADTGMKAIICLNKKQYDCIVLDIVLPDIDGFTLCKAVRTLTTVPIIFLTSINTSHDKVKGFMVGGDDYMTKPHCLDELTARIHAHLRREQRGGISFGQIFIDKQGRRIQTPEQNLFLTQKEFEIFLLLFENPNKMFSKREIQNTLWADGTDMGTVAVHIMKLRRKLNFVKTYTGAIENDNKNGYYISRNNIITAEIDKTHEHG